MLVPFRKETKMTATRKPKTAGRKTRKPKLKKETLKDLSPKKSTGVKGGWCYPSCQYPSYQRA